MGKLRRSTRPSPATVIACLALVVAVGGSAAAATGDGGPKAEKSNVDVNRDRGLVVRQNSVEFPEQVPGDGNYISRKVAATCVGNEVATGGGTYWFSGGNVANEPNEVTSYLVPLRNTQKVPYGYEAKGLSDSSPGAGGSPPKFTVFVNCLKFATSTAKRKTKVRR